MWWRVRPRFLQYEVVNQNLILTVAFYQGEIWLTQKQMAQIFNLRLATVNEHLKKILQSEQWGGERYTRQFQVKAKDGKKYLVNHYRLEIVEQLQERMREI